MNWKYKSTTYFTHTQPTQQSLASPKQARNITLQLGKNI